MENISVLIVDDQVLFADSMKMVFDGFKDSGISVIGVAHNGAEAVEAVERKNPDVILMDVRMPVMDGVEATRLIKQSYPEIKIIILTTFDDDSYVHSALNYGADGYVLKNIKSEELINSVKSVYGGTMLISPKIGSRLLTKKIDYGGTKEEYVANLMKNFDTLSKREAEILYILSQGHSNKQIAEILYIAEQTVKNHLEHIYSKLNVSTRSQAIHEVFTKLSIPFS